MTYSKKRLLLGAGLVVGLAASISTVMVLRSGKGKASAASGNETMFQGYEWNISSTGNHWNELSSKADELSAAGVTSIWLPPAYKGSNANDTGYSPYDLYDLGEFNQKGSKRTKYGTKDQYISLIDTMHDNNIKVYADIVLNHKGGADATETVSAFRVNDNDRNTTVGEAKDIEAWTAFNFEGRNGTYSSFKWNASHFDGVDYDNKSKSNGIYRFADKAWDTYVSTENGNYDYLMYADIDFSNNEVVTELNSWGKWYVDTAKLDGFRLDAVKHISATFYKNWLQTVRTNTGKNLFSVAEYYDYDTADLKQYIKDTKKRTNVFDFSLQGNFVSASNGDFDMSTLFKGTLSESMPYYSVNFVENHDTQASQNSNYMQNWFKGQAYTAILTRDMGTPCVFYGDYYGTNDGKNKPMMNELNVLMSARKYCAYGAEHNYIDNADVIGWTREGNYYHNYGLAAIISDGEAGSKKMFVGRAHKNETWVDVTGNCEGSVTIDKKGYATFSVTEKSYSVWVSEDAASDINKNITSINDKSKFDVPKDNTVTVFYNTTWSPAYFHYQIGSGDWTTSPGDKLSNTNLADYKILKIDLGTAQYVTGCFNNGGNNWDSNNGGNYKLSAGTYYVTNGTVNSGAPKGYDADAAVVEDKPDEEEPAEPETKDSSLTVYYYTSWETPYIHYSVGSGAWTSGNGVAMTKTEVDGYYSMTIPANTSETTTMCFNDNNGNWDSCGGSNYTLATGSFIIKNGMTFEGTLDDLDTIFNSEGDNELTIYYYADSSWTNVNCHYGVNGTWTDAPGVAMTKQDGSDNVYVLNIKLGSATAATLCFNNGTDWDSNSGSNYSITAPGSYKIKDYTITAME